MVNENGSTALAVVPERAIDPARAFEPRSLEEAFRLAKVLVESRLLPKAVTTPQAAFTIIATGRELGLTAMQSLRSIHVVEGKPTLSADLLVALVKQHSTCEYFRIVTATDEECTVETKRRGEPEPTRMTWTIEQAKAAGLITKDNWRKYPRAMLRARVSAEICRAVYPDVAMGLYDPDEMQAEPERRNVVTVAPLQQEPAAAPSEPTIEAEPATELSEDQEDALLATSKELLERLDAAATLEEVRKLKVSVEALVEPFRKPVVEKYRAVLRVKKAEAAKSAASQREPGEEG